MLHLQGGHRPSRVEAVRCAPAAHRVRRAMAAQVPQWREPPEEGSPGADMPHLQSAHLGSRFYIESILCVCVCSEGDRNLYFTSYLHLECAGCRLLATFCVLLVVLLVRVYRLQHTHTVYRAEIRAQWEQRETYTHCYDKKYTTNTQESHI